MLPVSDQNDAHDQHGACAHQGGELHAVHLHAEERHGGIAADAAHGCACNQTEEGEQVAANGVEGDAAGGILLRQIGVENVGIG